MSMPYPDRPIDLVLQRLDHPQKRGDRWMARCPAHDDTNPSLSIREGEDGRVLLNCFAQCETSAVVEAMGLTMQDLFIDEGPPREPIRLHRKPVPPPPSLGPVVATYDYPDATGAVLHRVTRHGEPKSFRPWHRDTPSSPWTIGGRIRLLYRLPELLESINRSNVVFVVEGEKDVDRAYREGITATTNASGAGKVDSEMLSPLTGQDVVIIPDNDEPGRRHAQLIGDLLSDIARTVQIVTLDGLPAGGDLSDWFDAGNTVDRLVGLLDQDPPGWIPRPPETTPIVEFPSPVAPAWPVLSPKALHGLLGRIVTTLDPYTEADPVAVAVTLLTFFGCAIGRSPHMMVSGDRHGTNENSIIVGDTAKARKGTSQAYPRRIITLADPEFARRITGGIASGEGIVWAIRDRITTTKKGVEVVEDDGVDDKRLLPIEEEYSSVLKVAGRDGNTASEMLRRAWDARPLHSLAKNSPGRCEFPHVSFLGHITRTELIRELDDIAVANGLANRNGWFLVRRSKLLPEGGNPPPNVIENFADDVRVHLAAARRLGEIHRTPAARARWAEIYTELSAPGVGMLGALSARSEAHVLRYSLIYALFDGATKVDVPHLEAALALWQYSATSIKVIFGDSLGNPVADRILAALAVGPLTRTQIRDLFGKNAKATTIEASLNEIREAGRATSIRVPSDAGGRPAEQWELVA